MMIVKKPRKIAGICACAVSAYMKSPHNAGEVESIMTSRIPANLERKLKENNSMPGKQKGTEGVYVFVLQVLYAR